MQNYKDNYNNALRSLYIALSQKSPTAWKNYWSVFHQFYISKITKDEYNRLVYEIIGEENMAKHNILIFSLLLCSTQRQSSISNSSLLSSNVDTIKSRSKTNTESKRGRKKNVIKDTLSYSDKLRQENIPLLLQYYTSISQITPLMKSIKSVYQQYQACITQKHIKSNQITVISPYTSNDYSSILTSPAIETLFVQNQNVLNMIIKKQMIFMFQSGTAMQFSDTYINVLRRSIQHYIIRILYAIKFSTQTGVLMMKTHLNDTNDSRMFIPTDTKEHLYANLPLLKQVFMRSPSLLGPLYTYHITKINSIPIFPVKVQMTTLSSIHNNTYNTLKIEKQPKEKEKETISIIDSDKDSENDNINTLH